MLIDSGSCHLSAMNKNPSYGFELILTHPPSYCLVISRSQTQSKFEIRSSEPDGVLRQVESVHSGLYCAWRT